MELEKGDLESQVLQLRTAIQGSRDKNTMLIEQVNNLLLDKVKLQAQSIGQKDEALRSERDLGSLRTALAGKSLPKEAEDLIQALQSSHASSEAQTKSLQDKLHKAKAVSTTHRTGPVTDDFPC